VADTIVESGGMNSAAPIFAVAPMMDWTDRHCRVLHRLLSKHARLYTEMITADAVIHGNHERLLGFSEIEHPVAIQLGGADPRKLAAAAKIASDYGYDEINLNCGCPSGRVQSGCFGAILMRDPHLTAECAGAMRGAVSIPVTVKCRIGIDDQNPEEALPRFVEACAAAGIDSFMIHARKAWLSGLSPAENRDIPPLDYALVYRFKRDHNELKITINGGVASLAAASEHLRFVDGVMLGRAAYQNPAILADVDSRFFGAHGGGVEQAVKAYTDYIDLRLREGVPLNAMTRHMLGLFQGQRGARQFRRHLSENAVRNGAGLPVVLDALAFVQMPSPARAA
jgi:tRNA-dihydrouridine synthase A